jgi:hypothetical protein
MYMMYSKSSSMMIMHLGQRKMCNARCIRTFIVTFSLDLETKGAVWSVCEQGQQLALLAAVLLSSYLAQSCLVPFYVTGLSCAAECSAGLQVVAAIGRG